MFCNMICLFLQWGVVSTSSKPQAGGPPLVGYPWLFIQYIRSYPRYWKPFLHLQPEDVPYRGDRDPLIADYFFGSILNFFIYYIKIIFVSFLFVWVHGTTHRLCYDKLMYYAWKKFLPLSLNFVLFFSVGVRSLFFLCYSALTTPNPATTKRKLYLLL